MTNLLAWRAWVLRTLVGVCISAAGCGNTEPASQPAPEAAKLIRLIDQLDAARVESPLLRVGSGKHVFEIAPGDEIWRGALDAAQPSARIPTRPGTALRVESGGHSSYDCWRATEHAGETALREHRPSESLLAIQTTPRTDALVLTRFTGPRGSGREAEPTECDAPIPLVVERVALDPALELALLKDHAPAEGADPLLGIAKHGQLLPVPEVDEARPPFDHNFDFRDALYAPTPSDLSFDLALPGDAQLRFSIALHARSRPGDSATFSVLIGADGEAPREIFEQALALDEAGSSWHWHDVHLDLSEYGGRDVTLTLRTRAPGGGRAHALFGNAIVDAPRAPSDPPNVIVIAVDTLRADRVGPVDGQSLTPRLDALAADGVHFDQAISSSNWTRPSFASIFTGLSPARHGVIERLAPLAPERTTIAELFRDAGWVTHAILYKPYLYDDGHHQGFDTYFNVPQTAKFAEQNLRKALIWIQKNRERRFFLFVHFDDPHQPLTQPYEFISAPDRARMQELGLALPAFVDDREAEFRDPETGRQARCAGCAAQPERFRELARNLYDDEVAFVDDRIGALLDYLEETGLYDDALIAFVSDHGEALWSHDDTYGHGGGNLYDPLIVVPLTIKPPASSGFARGSVVGEQVRAFDLMPTLLDLAGIEPDLALDARSLSPLMSRPLVAPVATAAESPEPRLAIAQSEWGIAIRTGDAKYMHWGPDAREAWYDLRADPGETRDLAANAPAGLGAARLAAADYYASGLPGRFVAVTGVEPGQALRVRVRWSEPARLGRAGSLGLGTPAETSSESFEFIGNSAGGLGFLAHFEAPPAAIATVEVEAGGVPVAAPDGFAAYDAGALARAATAAAPRVHLIEGSGASPVTSTPASLDAQRLEALRTLGYLE